MQSGNSGPRKRKRIPFWLKIIFFLVIAALVAAGGVFWYWKTHKKAIIRDKLVKTIHDRSDGLYNIQFSDLSLDELAGSLSISRMHFVFDSTRFRAIEKTGNAPPMLIKMDIREVNVTGIKSPKDLRKSKMKGAVMVIKNPVIEIVYTDQGKKKKQVIPTKEEIYKDIIGGMDMELDSLIITGAEIRTRNIGKARSIVEVKDASIALLDLKVNEEGRQDKTRLFFSKQFRMHAGKVVWHSNNQMYNYNVLNMSMESKPGELKIEKFLVIPIMGEDAFVKALPYQDDRFDFTFEGIHVNNVNPDKLIDEYLEGDKMMVRSAHLRIYRDLNRPRDHKNRVGQYPHQAMNKTAFRFTINQLFLPHAFIEYKEKNNITHNVGRVQFFNASGTINNLTNDTASVTKNNLMTLDFRSRFLNLTPLQMHWVFYLMNPQGRFDVKGNAGPVDATLLNPLIVPSGPAKIDQGTLNDLQFNFKGSNLTLNGSVTMLYKGLKVTLLEKDKGAMKLDKKFLTSLFANVIIKNENPKRNDPPRIVQLSYPRDINRSLFNFCWKALFKGMKESVGIKK